MKKLLSLLLALGLVFSLAGCAFLPADGGDTAYLDEIGSILDELEELTEESVSPTEEATEQTAPSGETVTESITQKPTQPVTEEETQPVTEEPTTQTEEETPPDVNGTYTSKEDVALYIHHYGRLPKNFITKKQARELGWKSGSLEKYAPGKCIGGDHFGNYEGLLPKAPGRKYTECDIDTLGARSRGAKRIVFSNDGLIYYTNDHYESFTLLYGEE